MLAVFIFEAKMNTARILSQNTGIPIIVVLQTVRILSTSLPLFTEQVTPAMIPIGVAKIRAGIPIASVRGKYV